MKFFVYSYSYMVSRLRHEICLMFSCVTCSPEVFGILQMHRCVDLTLGFDVFLHSVLRWTMCLYAYILRTTHNHTINSIHAVDVPFDCVLSYNPITICCLNVKKWYRFKGLRTLWYFGMLALYTYIYNKLFTIKYYLLFIHINFSINYYDNF